MRVKFQCFRFQKASSKVGYFICITSSPVRQNGRPDISCDLEDPQDVVPHIVPATVGKWYALKLFCVSTCFNISSGWYCIIKVGMNYQDISWNNPWMFLKHLHLCGFELVWNDMNIFRANLKCCWDSLDQVITTTNTNWFIWSSNNTLYDHSKSS